MIFQKKEQIDKKKFMISEEKKRKFLLEGNLWKVILYVTFPITIYLVFQAIFNSYDIFLLRKKLKIDDELVSSINRIHLLKDIFISFGASIATAGVILVGRNYGRKNLEKMRLYLSQTFVLTIIIGLIIAILCTVFFKTLILEHIVNYQGNKQEDLKKYYLIIFCSLVCIIINIVFLALERAKGNNKIVLWVTLSNIAIKIILSLVFFEIKNQMKSLAWATLIAHASVTLFTFWFLFLNQKNYLKIFSKKFRFDKIFLKNLFTLSIPICISIIVFNLGKIIISMVVKTNYDDGTNIDAQLVLAVSVNNIFFNIINSFADSQNTIISQNLGQKKMNRVFETFKKIIILIVLLAFVGTLIHLFCYGKILYLMTGENYHNLACASDTKTQSAAFRILFFYETTGLWLTCFSIILCSFFVCFKKTKIALNMNLLRIISGIFFLFLFSAPIFSSFNEVHKVGFSLFLGNLICFITTLSFFIPFYRKTKKENTTYEDKI
ncbi:MATE family Na+-driven multidrug efflux pump [Candidatus Phytoplasma solani]|uniref:MATE family efflux transporter n=1 Tax=Candidatus Phytoplasma solani TaxID=69896 RepID=UPI0032DBBD80